MPSPRSFGAETTASEGQQDGDERRARDPEAAARPRAVPESPVGEASASGV